MSRLLAQCGQNITATFDEPKSVITVHREGRGSCLTNNTVRLFASYDSGGWVEINDCYLPAGSVCQQDTPGSVACAAEGEHRADVFVICNIPGPNNGCVEASGGMPVFYNLSHSVSVSAGVFGAPYYDNHNNKLMNFKVHAEWQGAASSQLLVEYNIATADPNIWITRITYATGPIGLRGGANLFSYVRAGEVADTGAVIVKGGAGLGEGGSGTFYVCRTIAVTCR